MCRRTTPLSIVLALSAGFLAAIEPSVALRGTGDAWGAADDLIDELPDFGKTPTPHYSGYLDGSDGCDRDTNGPDCWIHYWLALAEDGNRDGAPVPADAPVVLWLNGGPGSSSLLGFLQELGPLMMNATGGLMENPWGWTKVVNLLAIEAPMGVGYSYCSRQVDGWPCENTDHYTASTSRAALVDFFTNKFPEFADNDFFITGESYAGVYVPTLAKEILDETNINLKGIAVGDPCTDNEAQADSMDELWYGHKNGLVDDEIYDLLWNECGVRAANLMTRGGVHSAVHEFNRELRTIDDPVVRAARAAELHDSIVLGNDGKFEGSDECKLAYRKFLLGSSNGLSQGWKDLYVDPYSLFAPVTSLEDDQLSAYLSRRDVREALHVTDAPTDTWPDAKVGFDYSKEYRACNWNEDIPLQATSMIDVYREIVPQLERTWIYNGDTDPCVSYEGTRLAVKQTRFHEVDGGSYRPWYYDHAAVPTSLLEEKSALFGPDLGTLELGAQMGGEVTNYEHDLKFVTFHGSGHMVPQFRPQSALHFLRKFVGGEELSPLMPSNATLTEMSDETFEAAMKQWTESARGAASVKKGTSKERRPVRWVVEE